jgi:hypothetical protein
MLNARRSFPYLAILALVFLTYYRVIVGNALLLDRDLYWFFYQNSRYLARYFSAGKIPLWNPYVSNGEPFFAQAQPGVLYPPDWLYAWIPVDALFSRLLVSHVALFGVFTALLVRELGGGRVAAAIGGISVAFSGITTSLIPLQSSLFAISWLPLALWSLVRSLKRDSIVYSILAGTAFCMMVLVGGIEVLAMGLALAAALTALPRYFPIDGDIPTIKKRFCLFGIMLLALFLLSAAQLLPFVELTRYSYRTSGVSVGEALTWSVHPIEWLYFVIPDAFRRGRDFYWVEQNWLRATYIGVVTLLLGSVFIWKNRRRALGFVVLALGCLLLATGGYLPFYRDIVPWIPGLRSIRYPSKFLMIFGFLAALAAAFGWESLAQRQRNGRQSKGATSIFLALSVSTAVLFLACSTTGLPVEHWMERIVADRGSELSPGGLLHNLRRFLAFSSLTSMSIFTAMKSGKTRVAGLVTIPSLLILDLMGAMPYATLFYPSDSLKGETGRISALKGDSKGLFRIYSNNRLWERKFKDMNQLIEMGTDLFMPNTGMQERLYQSQGYRVLTLSRVDQIMNSILHTSRPDSSRLVDLLNIRYMLWPTEINSPKYRLIDSSDSLYFYEDRGVLPRAFLVDTYRVCHTGEEFQKIMMDPSFEPCRFLLLDKEPRLPPGWDPEGKSNSCPTGGVEVLLYEPERIRLRVDATTSRFLFLGDAYFPGWKAFVDGRPREVLRADYAFRAIAVERGQHIIEFRYEPRSVIIGSVISAGSILLILGSLISALAARILRTAAAGLRAKRDHLAKRFRIKACSSHQ